MRKADTRVRLLTVFSLTTVRLASYFLFMPTPAAYSAEEPEREILAIYDQVQTLLSKYYPKASFEKTNGNFRAKFDTRTFMIHHALKTGEWQDAHPQEGPNRKGIQCSISFSPGPWNGAAMVPQTFDYRYFSSLLMAPYNKKLNKHLVSHLDYPSDTSAEFVKEYSKLISSFSGDTNKQ